MIDDVSQLRDYNTLKKFIVGASIALSVTAVVASVALIIFAVGPPAFLAGAIVAVPFLGEKVLCGLFAFLIPLIFGPSFFMIPMLSLGEFQPPHYNDYTWGRKLINDYCHNLKHGFSGPQEQNWMLINMLAYVEKFPLLKDYASDELKILRKYLSEEIPEKIVKFCADLNTEVLTENEISKRANEIFNCLAHFPQIAEGIENNIIEIENHLKKLVSSQISLIHAYLKEGVINKETVKDQAQKIIEHLARFPESAINDEVNLQGIHAYLKTLPDPSDSVRLLTRVLTCPKLTFTLENSQELELPIFAFALHSEMLKTQLLEGFKDKVTLNLSDYSLKTILSAQQYFQKSSLNLLSSLKEINELRRFADYLQAPNLIEVCHWAKSLVLT